MALTIEQIKKEETDKGLLLLLTGELERWLPEALQKDRDRYHATLPALPRGLRAMAGMYFLDVSMALDSLAWHFGNQNDERDLQETLDGLQELEMPEIAAMFAKMWEFMKPHMSILQSGEFGGKDFADWLEEIGAEELASPMNDIIWKFCSEQNDFGLLASWIPYARKYPDRCIVT